MCVGPVEGAINNELFGAPDPIGESITGWRDPLSASLFGKKDDGSTGAAQNNGPSGWDASKLKGVLGQTPIGQSIAAGGVNSPVGRAFSDMAKNWFHNGTNVQQGQPQPAAQPAQSFAQAPQPSGLMRRMPSINVRGL